MDGEPTNALTPEVLNQVARIRAAGRIAAHFNQPTFAQLQDRLRDVTRLNVEFNQPAFTQLQDRLRDVTRLNVEFNQPAFTQLQDRLRDVTRLNVEFSQPAFTQLQDRLRDVTRLNVEFSQPAFTQLQDRLREVARRAAEFAARAAEQQRRLLDDLRGQAEELEATADLEDAAFFLRRGLDLFEETGDEREFAIAIHHAVSAVEEVARRRARMPTATLGGAARALERRGVVTAQQFTRILRLYGHRSSIPGAAHGAGGCPEYVARFVLSDVRASLRAFGFGMSVRPDPTRPFTPPN